VIWIGLACFCLVCPSKSCNLYLFYWLCTVWCNNWLIVYFGAYVKIKTQIYHKYLGLSTALQNTIRDNLHLNMDTIPNIFWLLNSVLLNIQNRKYHHFRQYIFNIQIEVRQVSTEDQTADICKKNLPETSFVKFGTMLLGW
jgi:hypothetical protein